MGIALAPQGSPPREWGYSWRPLGSTSSASHTAEAAAGSRVSENGNWAPVGQDRGGRGVRMGEAVPEPGPHVGPAAQGAGPRSLPVLSRPAGVHALSLVDELISLPLCFRGSPNAPSRISVARRMYSSVPSCCVFVPTFKLMCPDI